MNIQTKVAGVILAGGLARRMDHQDKGLVRYKGEPLVSYAINALAKVADQVIINANRNHQVYEQFGLAIVADRTNRFDGPLAGVLTAMLYTDADILLVMPCDTPLVESKHLQKLLTRLLDTEADVAVASDGERLHPVLLAIKTSLKISLTDYLDAGHRKVEQWLKQQNTVIVDFSQEAEIFININSLAELAELEAKSTIVQAPNFLASH